MTFYNASKDSVSDSLRMIVYNAYRIRSLRICKVHKEA